MAKKWNPMKRGHYTQLSDAQIEELIRLAKKEHGEEMTREDIIREATDDEVWLNDLYQCSVKYLTSDGIFGPVHLSIKRRNRMPCRDWRVFQRIKNDVVGDDRWAVEMYPPESQLVDTANQYHLWVLPKGDEPPMGFKMGRIVSESATSSTRQRKFS